ncbi:MAG: indolepyruvate oxidoreductase subunit beta [Bacillota bacterium]|nr:indolepyruvate oxidoreductase subunit beta [Bacillota bacterium]
MNKDILLCGVGGQGTVLAAKILAATAMDVGETVHSAETIGMAQRGGSVTSHVRIGEALSPLIPEGSADILMAFEPAEAVRNLQYLRRDGIVIVNSMPVKPVSESLKGTAYDGGSMIEYLERKCDCIVMDAVRPDSAKFLNIAMLGVAAGTGRLGFTKEQLLAEIEKRVPRKFLDANREAFEQGISLGETR